MLVETNLKISVPAQMKASLNSLQPDVAFLYYAVKILFQGNEDTARTLSKDLALKAIYC